MAKPITMPICIRIGNTPEREIGTIEAATWTVAKSAIAAALREAADVLEADDESC